MLCADPSCWQKTGPAGFVFIYSDRTVLTFPCTYITVRTHSSSSCAAFVLWWRYLTDKVWKQGAAAHRCTAAPRPTGASVDVRRQKAATLRCRSLRERHNLTVCVREYYPTTSTSWVVIRPRVVIACRNVITSLWQNAAIRPHRPQGRKTHCLYFSNLF